MKYLIANWKCHKTLREAKEWFNVFARGAVGISSSSWKVVVCPPAVYLGELHRFVSTLTFNFPLSLGVQTISSFSQGPFTGEVSAEMVSGWVDTAIIGHSEQRDLRGVSDKDVSEKVRQAWNSGILPVVCVSQFDQVAFVANQGITGELVLAYEPSDAISRGGEFNPAEPRLVAGFIEAINPIFEISIPVVYGGSLNPGNIDEYLSVDVAGFLVGQASLEANSFSEILEKVVGK